MRKIFVKVAPVTFTVIEPYHLTEETINDLIRELASLTEELP